MKSWIDWVGVELDFVSPKEKWIAGLGGFAAILILIWVSCGHAGFLQGPQVVASMGASAVLLFAVPQGQLSQPWPLIAGHGLSGLIGVACARWIPMPMVAAAVAVGLSIGVMHQFKCIHPPGGATALTAVMGGAAIRDLGFGFVLFPVLTNAVLMVGLAVLINLLFKWRRYPAAFSRVGRIEESAAARPSHEEVVAALKQMDGFIDITEEDLVRLCQLLSRAPRVSNREPGAAA